MIKRLIEKIKEKRAPVCVGLDPMLSFIPEHLKKEAYDELGEGLDGAAQAVWKFNKEIIAINAAATSAAAALKAYAFIL